MGWLAESFSSFGYALTALVYGAFAAYLVMAGYAGRAPTAPARAFQAAVAATAAWSVLALLEPGSKSVATSYATAGLDLLRYGLWFAFLLQILRSDADRGPNRTQRNLTWAAFALITATLATIGWRIAHGLYQMGSSRAYLFASLALAVYALVLVEQLFRSLTENSRWNAKPVCLGLAIVFSFDLYLFSGAVLLGDVDPDAQSARGVVHMLAVPLLWLSTSRRVDWIGKLQVSRAAVFHSASLLLAGGYLLFMSAAGYYVRYFGGQWGPALQVGLLAAAIALLSVFVFSGAVRAKLRVFVGKHFFRYRFDYREQWLRFTAMLSTKGSQQEVGGLVVRALADMVECPAGSLWVRDSTESSFRQAARWNHAVVEASEPTTSSFSRFLQQQGWVVDLDEYRTSPRRYGEMAVPNWLLTTPDLWLVVPLLTDDELLGFVTLARPRTPLELNWEVRDLLKTASRQAAGFLAQMQAAEALLEARKFEAFNRMSAFVVHDLKNIVTQLSLMMKNAQRLHANPEFQQDMLLTVESSLEKMRRLMLQLREGGTPTGGTHGVELAPILTRLVLMAQSQGRSIETRCETGVATRGQEERLERVLGHLLHNALDATPASGKVWIHAARQRGQVVVEVGDNGEGMSEEFVQNSLFRPFSTTKQHGMGIGTYESFQYVRELGGSMEVDSQLKRGTRITVVLPGFEAREDLELPLSMRP